MHQEEVILARAECSWIRQDGWCVGELQLTNRQLTFWTDGAGVILRFPVFTIVTSVVTPLRKRLMVQSGDQSLWFTGDAISSLGRRLSALRKGSSDYKADEVIELAGPAWRWVGLIPVAGLVELTSERLRFIGLGITPLVLRKLGLRADIEFTRDQVKDGHPIRGPMGWLIGRIVAATQRPIASWVTRYRQRYGALMVTPSELRIIRKTEQRVPLRNVRAAESDGSTLTIHRYMGDPITVHLPYAAAARRRIQIAQTTVPGSPGATGDSVMQTPSQLPSEPDRVEPWTAETKAGLLDQIRSTRLWMPDGEMLEMTPGMAISTEDGIGIALPEHMPYPPPGTPLTIELGKPDGVHYFESAVACIEPLPQYIQIPRRGRLMVLQAPENIRYYNRRKAFRMPMELTVNAWRLRMDSERQSLVPDGDRITGELIDLSATGCGVQTEQEVSIGTRMFLELRINEHWIPLEAEVVRSGQGWPMNFHRLGIHFVNVPERLGKLLSQTVLAKQRSG